MTEREERNCEKRFNMKRINPKQMMREEAWGVKMRNTVREKVIKKI